MVEYSDGKKDLDYIMLATELFILFYSADVDDDDADADDDHAGIISWCD